MEGNMKNVNLDYQPFEAGLPLEQILGVPLVLRAVLTCQKNGIDALTIRVLPDDGAAVETLLKGDARVTMAWQCTTQTEQVDLSGPVLAGNVVFLGFALESILSGDRSGETSGAGYQVLSSATDRVAAEDLLMGSLVKDADGIISRNINRKISCFISRRLAGTSIHPNQVTAIVGLIGFAAFPFAMQGTWQGFALGGLCYYVSAILDGVDGELSRLKHLGSPLGAWLERSPMTRSVSHGCWVFSGG